MSALAVRPIAIAHDQHGAGLRDWIRVDVAPAPPPVGWLMALVAAFLCGVACAAAVLG